MAVTHIHLDHAGGVGDVARAFPAATVYVHEKGARHLVDPTRLIDSASRVYGPLLDSLYGRLDATPPERIHVLADGEEIRVSPDRVLTTVDSPGHAKHHLALHDSVSGVLFAGDAVGVRLPDAGVLRPSTPPPDFDLDLAVTLAAPLRGAPPQRPRPGPLRAAGRARAPSSTEAEETLRRWARWPNRRGATARTSRPPSTRAFAADIAGVDAVHREKLDTLNGVHSNAAGFRRWLDTRAQTAPPT